LSEEELMHCLDDQLHDMEWWQGHGKKGDIKAYTEWEIIRYSISEAAGGGYDEDNHCALKLGPSPLGNDDDLDYEVYTYDWQFRAKILPEFHNKY